MKCVRTDVEGMNLYRTSMLMPLVGSGVERIDLLCFLAGCCKKRLNKTLSVLSLSLGLF